MLYPLAFPTKAPDSERLTISRKQAATQSTFTYAEQVIHTSSQWQLQWNWGAMPHRRAEELAGWLDSLNGQVGSFAYYPRQSSVTTAGRKVLGLDAAPYSKTIVVTGWAANQIIDLRRGQFLQIANQLLRITGASAGADASGSVTITFEPELRAYYPAGQGVLFNNPNGIFRLNSSDGAGFTLTPDRKPELGTYQAREVI